MTAAKEPLPQRVRRFLQQDLWTLDASKRAPAQGYGVRVLRWLVFLVDGLQKDNVFLRASALTYATVLSIVPFLAVAFSVLKGLGFQNTELMRELLMRLAAERQVVVDQIIEYVNNTNVGALGALGASFLVLTVISLLSNVENAFNTIWQAGHARPLARKAADYISVSLVFPVLMVVAISITATLQNNVLVQDILSYSVASRIYLFLLKLTPFMAVWAALTFLYAFIPNTRVNLGAAFLGAVAAGTAWQVAQWVYVEFQVGVARSNAIYGSFAQLPIFLVWLYLSWVIVLIGAEMSYTFQNYSAYASEAKYRDLRHRERERIALAVLVSMARSLYKGEPPPTQRQLAETLALPHSLIVTIVDNLTQAGLAARLDHPREVPLALTRAPDDLRVTDALDALAMPPSQLGTVRGARPEPHDEAERRLQQDFPHLTEIMDGLDDCARRSEFNVSLKELAGRGLDVEWNQTDKPGQTEKPDQTDKPGQTGQTDQTG